MKLGVWKRGAKRPRRRERQERCGAVKKRNRKHSSRPGQHMYRSEEALSSGFWGVVLFLLFLNTCVLDRPTSHLTRGEGNLTFNSHDLSMAMGFKSERA